MVELPERAVLLLSGGMDSATLLWWMKSRVGEIHTVSIDYGQRHAVELDAAQWLSAAAGADSHRVLFLDLGQFGGNPLTEKGLDVPAASDKLQEQTVVPFRNLLFVTMAAAWGEGEGIRDLFISPVRDDFEAYRDCRKPFYDALQHALSQGAATACEIVIHTPFIEEWKKEIVSLGLELEVPYEITHTCYEGTRPACGKCDACVERLDAFRANAAKDPLDYLQDS